MAEAYEDLVKAFIKQELRKKLQAKFSALPWWCLLCGEGGNYEGERPADYWVPPASHECALLRPEIIEHLRSR